MTATVPDPATTGGTTTAAVVTPKAFTASPIVLSSADVPAYARHRFGIFSVADFKGPADGRWGMGVEFEDTCPMPGKDFPVACAPGSPVASLGITPADWSSTAVEARDLVYATKCYLLSKADNHARALAEFDTVEQAAVERMYAENAAKDGTAVTGTFKDAALALAALLDSWYSKHPGVMPTILATPGSATALGDRIERHGNHLETRTGERLAVAVGLLIAPTATKTKLLGTAGGFVAVGAPFGYRGTKHVFDIDEIDTNKTSTYAHATYLPGYRCGIEYVKVDTA